MDIGHMFNYFTDVTFLKQKQVLYLHKNVLNVSLRHV